MGLVNTVVPLAELERETVAWCREMLALSPFALRLVKASFNAHEDGYAGIQQLAHDANLLFYGNEEAAEGREAFKADAASPTSRSSPAGHEDLADGGAAADAAGGGGAGPGRDRGGGRSGPASCRGSAPSSPPWSARSSSRSGPTSPTTTPTRDAAPTPPTGSGRCGSPRPGWSRRSGS